VQYINDDLEKNKPLVYKSVEASEGRDPMNGAILLGKDNVGAPHSDAQSFPSPNTRKMSQFFQEKRMMSKATALHLAKVPSGASCRDTCQAFHLIA